MPLLSEAVAQATGYTEEEAKQILLKKMVKESFGYRNALTAEAITTDSWAAITLCYGTSDPKVFIHAVGKKKED